VGEFSFGYVVHHQISVSREGAKKAKQKHDMIESLRRRRNRHWPVKSSLMFFLMKENEGPACAKTWRGRQRIAPTNYRCHCLPIIGDEATSSTTFFSFAPSRENIRSGQPTRFNRSPENPED
jgi:hypothetical protein